MQKSLQSVLIRPIAALAALLTSAALLAQALAPVRSMEGVTEYQLPNGLQVLLAPNDLQPRTYINLVVKAGSAVEGRGEGGMAHLLEHMVFKGTPTTPDPMRAFTERSLSYNGTTNADRTNYFASMSPNPAHVQWYLGWLADAMSNSTIRKADLDSEMTVVRNEFERASSSVGRAVYEARMALTFPNHGYGRPTIGNLSDIENVPIERLQAFYKTWYRPDNMTLVVTGRFDAPATLAHVTSVFGALPKPAEPLPINYTREPVQQGVRGASIRRVGGQTMTLIGWRGAPTAHRDDAVLDVLAHALANSASGRFSTAINQTDLGTNVSVNHAAMKDYGVFNVGVQLAGQDKLDAVQTLLLSHTTHLAQKGVTAEELVRAQVFFASRRDSQKNSAESFGSSLAEAAAMGDWRLGFWHADNVANVTIADTQRAASQYLVDDNRVRVSYIPTLAAVRAPEALPTALGEYVAQGSVTAQTRSAGAGAQIKLERFEANAAQLDARTVRAVLPVGARMALIARPAAGDAIQGTLRIMWGNQETLRGQWATSLMGSLLLRGTATRSQQQLEDALNTLQSTMAVQSNVYGLTINFKSTRQHWPAFAALMHDVLRNPSFKEGTFNTWKKQLIATWQAGRDAPETLSATAVNRALFAYDPQDARYQPSNEEAIVLMNALTLSELKAFWAQFVGASVAQFAAVGALDAPQLQQDVSKLLGDWPTLGGASAVQRLASPLSNYAAQRRMIATPDKPSATYRKVHTLAADPLSRSGMALQLANAIIGVSSSSRIYTRLRKEAGLTYGTNSRLDGNEVDQVALFTIQGTVAPHNSARFETALNEVMQEIQTSGLTQAELSLAKQIAAERTQAGRDNDVTVAAILANNEYRSRNAEQRDFAYGDRLSEMLQSITLDELNAAAKRLVTPSNAVVVLTGDFK